MAGRWEHGDAHAQVWDVSIPAVAPDKVYDVTFQTNTSSFVIDLPSDHNYRILELHISGQARFGSTEYLEARLNNDSGTNYTYAIVNAYSTGPTAGVLTNHTSIKIAYGGNGATAIFRAVAYMFIEEGQYRLSISRAYLVGAIGNWVTNLWLNTTSKVLSINCFFGASGYLAAGSRVVVYAYK
jgi:hypothetical protein